MVNRALFRNRFPSSTPFALYLFGAPLLKPSSRKKGTLVIEGLPGNVAKEVFEDGQAVRDFNCGFKLWLPWSPSLNLKL